MPQPRSIADYFKRPHSALSTQDIHSETAGVVHANEGHTATSQSSPLTELSSSFLLNDTFPQSPDGSASQLKQSLLLSVKEPSKNQTPLQSQSSSGTTAEDPSAGASFNTSQRIIKDGREVVISSDGEDTDSIESLESPEDLFMRFKKPIDAAAGEKKEVKTDIAGLGMSLRSRRSKDDVKSTFAQSWVSVPKYKFTLDSLVTAALDDNETEASIARLKAAREIEHSKKASGSKSEAASDGSSGKRNQLHEGILTSALGDRDDEIGLQRLLDAVRRTEAFDLEKSWSFFDNESNLLPVLEFPRDSIAPGTYMAVLRDPESRERAFHSGIIDFALSRAFLPDNLVTWLFHSVPSEPRDSLRQAYCRVFQHATAERIKSLIRPDDITIIFQRLGASPKALTLSETAIPEAAPKKASRETPRHRALLLSVLELLRGAAHLFADDTREHTLIVLFRLALDVYLTSNSTICSELERTITAVLESVPGDTDDSLMDHVCKSIHNTFKDAVFQSRLLKHILPTSNWIATLRCRLAISFLTKDPPSLTEPPDVMHDLERILTILRDKRFDIKRYKGKGHGEYDYGELGAITEILNVAIDSGWSGLLQTKEAEQEFNAQIDTLADRIKKIFTSIEDSGASHLKRTLAKEALEALHYRIVYSVRSKPRPKKTLFGDFGTESGHKAYSIKDKFSVRIPEKDKKDTGMPIRSHEIPS